MQSPYWVAAELKEFISCFFWGFLPENQNFVVPHLESTQKSDYSLLKCSPRNCFKKIQGALGIYALILKIR